MPAPDSSDALVREQTNETIRSNKTPKGVLKKPKDPPDGVEKIKSKNSSKGEKSNGTLKSPPGSENRSQGKKTPPGSERGKKTPPGSSRRSVDMKYEVGQDAPTEEDPNDPALKYFTLRIERPEQKLGLRFVKSEIVLVHPGSWAAKNGIEVDDEIWLANGKFFPALPRKDRFELMAKVRPLEIQIKRPKYKDTYYSVLCNEKDPFASFTMSGTTVLDVSKSGGVDDDAKRSQGETIRSSTATIGDHGITLGPVGAADRREHNSSLEDQPVVDAPDAPAIPNILMFHKAPNANAMVVDGPDVGKRTIHDKNVSADAPNAPAIPDLSALHNLQKEPNPNNFVIDAKVPEHKASAHGSIHRDTDNSSTMILPNEQQSSIIVSNEQAVRKTSFVGQEEQSESFMNRPAGASAARNPDGNTPHFAFHNGIRPGDRIIEINGKWFTDLLKNDLLADLLKGPRPLMIHFKRPSPMRAKQPEPSENVKAMARALEKARASISQNTTSNSKDGNMGDAYNIESGRSAQPDEYFFGKNSVMSPKEAVSDELMETHTNDDWYLETLMFPQSMCHRSTLNLEKTTGSVQLNSGLDGIIIKLDSMKSEEVPQKDRQKSDLAVRFSNISLLKIKDHVGTNGEPIHVITFQDNTPLPREKGSSVIIGSDGIPENTTMGNIPPSAAYLEALGSSSTTDMRMPGTADMIIPGTTTTSTTGGMDNSVVGMINGGFSYGGVTTSTRKLQRSIQFNDKSLRDTWFFGLKKLMCEKSMIPNDNRKVAVKKLLPIVDIEILDKGNIYDSTSPYFVLEIRCEDIPIRERKGVVKVVANSQGPSQAPSQEAPVLLSSMNRNSMESVGMIASEGLDNFMKAGTTQENEKQRSQKSKIVEAIEFTDANNNSKDNRTLLEQSSSFLAAPGHYESDDPRGTPHLDFTFAQGAAEGVHKAGANHESHGSLATGNDDQHLLSELLHDGRHNSIPPSPTVSQTQTQVSHCLASPSFSSPNVEETMNSGMSQTDLIKWLETDMRYIPCSANPQEASPLTPSKNHLEYVEGQHMMIPSVTSENSFFSGLLTMKTREFSADQEQSYDGANLREGGVMSLFTPRDDGSTKNLLTVPNPHTRDATTRFQGYPMSVTPVVPKRDITPNVATPDSINPLVINNVRSSIQNFLKEGGHGAAGSAPVVGSARGPNRTQKSLFLPGGSKTEKVRKCHFEIAKQVDLTLYMDKQLWQDVMKLIEDNNIIPTEGFSLYKLCRILLSRCLLEQAVNFATMNINSAHLAKVRENARERDLKDLLSECEHTLDSILATLPLHVGALDQPGARIVEQILMRNVEKMRIINKLCFDDIQNSVLNTIRR